MDSPLGPRALCHRLAGAPCLGPVGPIGDYWGPYLVDGWGLFGLLGFGRSPF